jgi:hypothetical protein
LINQLEDSVGGTRHGGHSHKSAYIAVAVKDAFPVILTEDGGIGPPVTILETTVLANALNVEDDVYVGVELTFALARIDPFIVQLATDDVDANADNVLLATRCGIDERVAKPDNVELAGLVALDVNEANPVTKVPTLIIGIIETLAEADITEADVPCVEVTNVANADNVLDAGLVTLAVTVAFADCVLLTDIVGVEDRVAKALRLAD